MCVRACVCRSTLNTICFLMSMCVCVQINPEHYVFSSFGVLHVYPDQPAESMTLAQWQRSAVLWKAISAIPFFKHYLMRKAFSWWVGTETTNQPLVLCFMMFMFVTLRCIIDLSFLKMIVGCSLFVCFTSSRGRKFKAGLCHE